jgi:putative addiction module killer protein
MKYPVIKYWIDKTKEFDEWFVDQPPKSKFQIDTRLISISIDGYFGDHKSVDSEDLVWELKWKNGRRVYYAYKPNEKILVLLGGNKNGQEKDIKKAKRILIKSTELED